MATEKFIRFPDTVACSFRDSSDTSPWREPSAVFDIEMCGRRGSGRIEVRVDGYWSEVITMYINRTVDWIDKKKNYEWKFSLSHSAGGRLTELGKHHKEEHGYVAVVDDMDAELNFAAAIEHTACFGKTLQEMKDTFEHWHTVETEEREAKRIAEEAERRSRIDADAPLGIEEAKSIVKRARAILTINPSRSVFINMVRRGSDTYTQAEGSKVSMIVWRLSGYKIKESELLSELAESSHRSHLVEQA